MKTLPHLTSSATILLATAPLAFPLERGAVPFPRKKPDAPLTRGHRHQIRRSLCGVYDTASAEAALHLQSVFGYGRNYDRKVMETLYPEYEAMHLQLAVMYAAMTEEQKECYGSEALRDAPCGTPA